MVPNQWMTKIYQASIKYHNTIYLFGDTNQCDRVEKSSQIHYNYLESETIKKKMPRQSKIGIHRGLFTYDTKTRDTLCKFLKT